MQEEIDLVIETTEESMQSSVGHLQRELVKIRSGKASPDMLDGLRLDYYGTPTAISGVANIKVEDGRTLVIQPWEKKMIAEVEKAIFAANLGVTPQNNGEAIRIVIPPLTEERRKQLVKQASVAGEHAKVSIRNARRDAIEEVKKAVKNGYSEDAGKLSEETVENLTKKYVAMVENVLATKEKELMTV
jgi:ribosome recycling factor